MLIIILAVIAVLAIFSYFKAEVWFKWLILIFGICFVAEALFILGWYRDNKEVRNLPILEKEKATIEQQITNIEKELLQGNLTEEKLDSILETYEEMQIKLQYTNDRIENNKSWLEEGRENMESIIFLK